MTPFNLEKIMAAGGKCVTRDGRPARILHILQTDGMYPVVAVISPEGCRETLQRNTREGRCVAGFDDMGDLLPIPIKHKRELWFNVYAWGCTSVGYDTEEDAIKSAIEGRIHTFKQTLEWTL